MAAFPEDPVPGAAANAGQGSAADRAFAWLRARIVRGAAAPGSMLSENEIAAALGMSRTPVRQALSRLQDEGWLTIYPKRGALVHAIGAAEAAEMAEARALLESDGVARADAAGLAALGRRLAGVVDEQEAALAGGDIDRFVVLTQAFHRAFVEVGGNRLLLAMYDRLRHRQAMLLLRDHREILDRAEPLIAEHRALVALAAAGDAGAFRAALAAHGAATHGELLRIPR